MHIYTVLAALNSWGIKLHATDDKEQKKEGRVVDFEFLNLFFSFLPLSFLLFFFFSSFSFFSLFLLWLDTNMKKMPEMALDS